MSRLIASVFVVALAALVAWQLAGPGLRDGSIELGQPEQRTTADPAETPAKTKLEIRGRRSSGAPSAATEIEPKRGTTMSGLVGEDRGLAIAGGSIHGVVVSESNEPIAGSTVRARARDTGSAGGRDRESFATLAGASATTDRYGRFVLADVVPGPLTVTATGKHREARRDDVFLRPGEKITGLTLCAERGAVAEVTVIDALGKPLAHAKVTARRHESTNAQQREITELDVETRLAAIRASRDSSHRNDTAETDGEGRAVLWGLEAGTYAFRAEHPSWARCDSQSRAVPSRGTVRVDLQMKSGGSVEVTALDAAGQPLAHALVRVESTATGETKHGATDSTGRTTIEPLAPGFYVASLPGTSTRRSYRDGELGQRALSSDRFAIHGSQAAKVRLVKPDLIDVSGVVRDGSGPVAGARVELTAIDPITRKRDPHNQHDTTTNKNGEYRLLDVDPGSYEVECRRSMRAFPLVEQLVVRSGVGSQTANFVLGRQSITVVVRGPDGGPVAQARLWLTPATSEPVRVTRSANGTTNGQGEGVLLDVLPGTYQLFVWSPRYAKQTISGVQVPGSDRIEVRLAAGGRISAVIDGSGSPFRISYRSEGAENWVTIPVRGQAREIESLAPGRYEVRVAPHSSGAQPLQWSAPVMVAVEAGRTAPVTLRVR